MYKYQIKLMPANQDNCIVTQAVILPQPTPSPPQLLDHYDVSSPLQ